MGKTRQKSVFEVAYGESRDVSCSCENYKFKRTRMQGRKDIFFVKISDGWRESDEGKGKRRNLFGKRNESIRRSPEMRRRSLTMLL